MLANVEERILGLRASLSSLPPEFVTASLKTRDKGRRQRQRQRLLDEHTRKREQRSKKAVDRAKEPVRKKVGKPVMWRSRPVDTRRQEEVDEAADSDADEAEFFNW